MSVDPNHDSVAPRADTDPGDGVSAESLFAQTVPGASEETIKTCCICGLDVSHKQRHRDRSGRYWCAHCQLFNDSADKTPASTPCPYCGRNTRQTMFVDHHGEKICQPCNQIYIAEEKNRLLHKAAVTAHPELEIRKLIRQMINIILALAAAAVVLTLYHEGLLYVRPKSWVPFKSVLYGFATGAVLAGVVIGIQYIRIAWRKRGRRAAYDQMIHAAANQILALEEENLMGASEAPEPLRKVVERAVARVEACAGQWNAASAGPTAEAQPVNVAVNVPVNVPGEIIESLAKKGDPGPLVDFLMTQRPATVDTVARNREIATISYLHSDFKTSSAAVTAILLRLPHDQDAMTRQALICFRNGELEQSKKTFKRVVNIAREKKNEFDLAGAFCNLGMLHVMLSEFDDAALRYSQAMKIYTSLNHEAGQADCLVNLGLIAYRKKEKGVECESNFRKAMAINKRLKRREGLATCCSMLGVILMEKVKPRLGEPERLLNRSVRLNLDLSRPVGVATAYGNLGLIRVKRGDLKGARDLFLKAQSIYQRINRPALMAKIQGMLKTLGTISAARAGK